MNAQPSSKLIFQVSLLKKTKNHINKLTTNAKKFIKSMKRHIIDSHKSNEKFVS